MTVLVPVLDAVVDPVLLAELDIDDEMVVLTEDVALEDALML